MARCKVVGGHAVYGVAPGGIVDIPDDEVRRFVRAGHVEVAQPAKRAPRRDGKTVAADDDGGEG